MFIRHRDFNYLCMSVCVYVCIYMFICCWIGKTDYMQCILQICQIQTITFYACLLSGYISKILKNSPKN